MGSYITWIQELALAWGGPGLFLVAFLDSSLLSLPEVVDLLLIWMVTRHEPRMLYYAACSTAGSVLGCLVLYSIGRKGDQWILRRFSATRVEKTMATFQRHGVLAVLIPSLLPPPAPFKIFVLLSGIAGIRLGKFSTAIAIGRGLRYFGEGALALWYGDQAIAFVSENGRPVGLALVALLLLGLGASLLWKRTQGRKRL